MLGSGGLQKARFVPKGGSIFGEFAEQFLIDMKVDLYQPVIQAIID